MTFLARLLALLMALFTGRTGHWVRVALLIAAGELLAHYVERDETLLSIRQRIYQHVHDTGPRKVKPRFTAVVLVDDDTYWRGEWPWRVPINRRLLAKIVAEVAAQNPAVIALDFDLSTGDEEVQTVRETPSGRIVLHVQEDYADETIELLDTLKRVSGSSVGKTSAVVLAEEIGRDPDDHWNRLADAHDGFDFQACDVTLGHILFDSDIRMLPTRLRMKDTKSVRAFSTAVASASNPKSVADLCEDCELFAGFITPGQIPQVNSRDLLHPESEQVKRQVKETLQHKIVLIGGGWHKNGYKRGKKTIDSHATPVGDLPGVMVHANYVESILDDRLLGSGQTYQLEIPLAILAAMALSLPRGKLARALALLAVVVLPLLMCHFFVRNFGIYFDVLVINLLLAAHAIAEIVIGWYRKSVKYDKLIATGAAPADH